MSAYALTPLAKADIFDIWSYIAEDSQDAAGRVEQAITALAPFLPKAPCAAIPAPTLQRARFGLDTNPLSELRRCLSARHRSASNRHRAARQKESSDSAHSCSGLRRT
jgi:hypothetical protein